MARLQQQAEPAPLEVDVSSFASANPIPFDDGPNALGMKGHSCDTGPFFFFLPSSLPFVPSSLRSHWLASDLGQVDIGGHGQSEPPCCPGEGWGGGPAPTAASRLPPWRWGAAGALLGIRTGSQRGR